MSSSGPKRKESDVYDRQIRLWGAEAQAKISKAKVLYIHCTGVSSEVLKNLVLAGVKASICDARPYPKAVLETPSFFLLDRHDHIDHENHSSCNIKKVKYSSVGHAMKAGVEELNPLLGECEIIDQAVEDLEDSIFSRYNIVVASQIGKVQASRIARATTANGGKFYMVDCFGWNGASVVDLGPTHDYRLELSKGGLGKAQAINDHVPIEQMWKVPFRDLKLKRVDKGAPPAIWMHYQAILEYHESTNSWPTEETASDFASFVQKWIEDREEPELKSIDAFSSKSLEELAKVATAELSPVCAILGGLIGNEVIKAISGKGEPANNAILADGFEMKCRYVLVKAKS